MNLWDKKIVFGISTYITYGSSQEFIQRCFGTLNKSGPNHRNQRCPVGLVRHMKNDTGLSSYTTHKVIQQTFRLIHGLNRDLFYCRVVYLWLGYGVKNKRGGGESVVEIP